MLTIQHGCVLATWMQFQKIHLTFLSFFFFRRMVSQAHHRFWSNCFSLPIRWVVGISFKWFVHFLALCMLPIKIISLRTEFAICDKCLPISFSSLLRKGRASQYFPSSEEFKIHFIFWKCTLLNRVLGWWAVWWSSVDSFLLRFCFPF